MAYTSGQIWGFVVILIGLVLTILNIIEKIILLKSKSKEPYALLTNRIEQLETWKISIEQRLLENEKHFERVDEGNKVTQQAILALMDNALSDNGSKNELKKARNLLYEYLSKK